MANYEASQVLKAWGKWRKALIVDLLSCFEIKPREIGFYVEHIDGRSVEQAIILRYGNSYFSSLQEAARFKKLALFPANSPEALYALLENRILGLPEVFRMSRGNFSRTPSHLKALYIVQEDPKPSFFDPRYTFDYQEVSPQDFDILGRIGNVNFWIQTLEELAINGPSTESKKYGYS